MTNSSETPVGYTYRAANYGPTELVNELVREGARSPGARSMTPEAVLDQWATEEGIERDDPWTYDSDNFPKPVYRDMLSCRDNDWTTLAPPCVWAHGSECAVCGSYPSHDY